MFRLPFLIKAAPSGRRVALCPMLPQAAIRGVRPPAGPRAASGRSPRGPRQQAKPEPPGTKPT